MRVIRACAIFGMTAMLALSSLPAAAARPHSGGPAQSVPSLVDAPVDAAAVPGAQSEPPKDATDGEQPNAVEQAPRDPLAPLDEPEQPSYVPSSDAQRVINWVSLSGDNDKMPFLVIDKVAAEVFAFDSTAQLVAASPVLVGMAEGDDSTPMSGDRELSSIPRKERTTPAGRFIAKFGPAEGHRKVLWVDFPDAISLHPVIAVRNQHRFERLKSPSPDDNRITYGCINVPSDFYKKVVEPMFENGAGVVYILPETKSLDQVFLAMPTQSPASAPAQTAQ